jgi:hypothetical protein
MLWAQELNPSTCPTQKDAKIPYEALRGLKPTLTRDRIWGSRA